MLRASRAGSTPRPRPQDAGPGPLLTVAAGGRDFFDPCSSVAHPLRCGSAEIMNGKLKGVGFWDDENVLKLMAVVVMQVYEHNKRH